PEIVTVVFNNECLFHGYLPDTYLFIAIVVNDKHRQVIWRRTIQGRQGDQTVYHLLSACRAAELVGQYPAAEFQFRPGVDQAVTVQNKAVTLLKGEHAFLEAFVARYPQRKAARLQLFDLAVAVS